MTDILNRKDDMADHDLGHYERQLKLMTDQNLRPYYLRNDTVPALEPEP